MISKALCPHCGGNIEITRDTTGDDIAYRQQCGFCAWASDYYSIDELFMGLRWLEKMHPEILEEIRS